MRCALALRFHARRGFFRGPRPTESPAHASRGTLRDGCTADIRDPARSERFLLERFGIAKYARDQARHCLDHHHRREFPAGEDVVADRDLAIDHFPQALIHAFVAAGYEQQAIMVGGELAYQRLIEQFSLRRHQHAQQLRTLRHHRVDRCGQRLRPHHHPAPAAIGSVVDLPVIPESIVAQVVRLNRNRAVFARPSNQPGIERGQHFGK